MAALERGAQAAPGAWLRQAPGMHRVWGDWLRGGTPAGSAGNDPTDDAAQALAWMLAGEPSRSLAAASAARIPAELEPAWRALTTFAAWWDGDASALHECYEAAILAEDMAPGSGTAAFAWYLAGTAHLMAGVHDSGQVAMERASRHARRAHALDLEMLAVLTAAARPDADEPVIRSAAYEASRARTRANDAGLALICVRAGVTEAELLNRLGDRAAARVRAEGALLRARTLPRGDDRARAAVCAARLRLAAGDDVGARAAVGMPADWLAPPAVPSWAWPLARTAMVVAGVSRDAELARGWASTMRRLFHAGRVPFEAVRIESEACQALANGQVAQADDLLDRARRLWHILGRSDLVEPALEPHDQHSDPFAHHSALTRRERQVARLVASRMTNAEIADTLQVSVRTAEHHVASILRKLGVSSRYALADVARTTDE